MSEVLTFYQCEQIIKKVKDWDSLNDLLTKQSLPKNRGRIFERFTQLYMQTKPCVGNLEWVDTITENRTPKLFTKIVAHAKKRFC